MNPNLGDPALGALSPSLATRLEKAAWDAGFDVELPSQPVWLVRTSTHASLTVWLGAAEVGHVVVAFSRNDVAAGLAEWGPAAGLPLPPGALAARTTRDVASAYQLLRRAYQLARSLPNALLQEFEARTTTLPRTTEAERMVVQRVGQDIFRAGLLDYWEGRCAVTGLAVPELLRASHIKPWAKCERDEERLDVFNGLLLAPHLDALFDGGWLTVLDDGLIMLSGRLDSAATQLLGLTGPMKVRSLGSRHQAYLSWHRERVFDR